MSALPEALGYARQGLRVLPCTAGTKEPAAGGGVYSATTDVDQLEQWWSWWPDANVAVSAQPSGLVFADLDRRPGHDGVSNFARLLDDHKLDWPETRTTVTPSDSRHLWFTRPAGVDLVGRTLAPGVQLIARGYALAPSSTVNGRHYRFTVDVPPAELPAPLAELCQRQIHHPAQPVPTRRVGVDSLAFRTLRRGARMIAQAAKPSAEHPGERNNTLFNAARWAGGLIAAGRLDQRTAETVLTDAAVAAGLEPDEIAWTIASGLKAGSDAPIL